MEVPHINKIRKYIDKGLKLIYPDTCALCQRLLSKNEKYICVDCETMLPKITGPTCLKCGKEISDEEQEFCMDCTKNQRSFVKGYPAMNYDEPFRESIAAFKYHSRKDYGKYFAYEIARSCGGDIIDTGAEVLVPVPVHRKKRINRGYNQAEILADELGRRLGLPVDSGLLERKANTLPQKNLDNIERENNLKKAFISTQKRVKYKKVMLVDDIYTTGATVEACTKVLCEAGVTDVFFTSICIGRGC